MLFNIGDAEMTVGELTLRGCYLGSNVSYNVKKLVETSYLAQERSVHDRRSIHVKLTKKGRMLRDRLSDMHERHIKLLKQTAVAETDLEAVVMTLRRLERFWMHTEGLAATPGNLLSDFSVCLQQPAILLVGPTPPTATLSGVSLWRRPAFS